MSRGRRSLPIWHSAKKVRLNGKALILLMSSLVASVFLASCGNGIAGSTTQTSSPSGHATVIVHASSARADQNAVAAATAHCASGEKLLSGGFTADIFEADAIVANYPSATDAWTVSGSSPASWISLTAYANCLANSGDMHVATVRAQSGGGTTTASCPAGSVLTGGGYQGATPRSSYPEGNAWALEWFGGQSATVWALCATRGLAADSVATSSYILPSGYGMSGGASASCGAGQVVTGGGFHNDGVYALIANALTSDGAGWSVGANANTSAPAATSSGTAYAVCVTPMA